MLTSSSDLKALELPKAFFSSSSDDLLREFYVPCLSQARTYDRAVGYFRSSLLALAGIPYTQFAQKGGRARIVCSPDLTPDDVQAMLAGYDKREIIGASLKREMDLLLTRPQGQPILSLLATLIAVGALDIRVAVKRDGGIFHHKVGIFSDGTNEVSFVGSANESWSAWAPGANGESFDVFTNWSHDAERVRAHRDFFEETWAGEGSSIEVFDLPDAFRQGLLHFAHAEGVEAIPTFVVPIPERVRSAVPDLFDHQRDGLEDWRRNGYRGILEHATGSGKTITAIAAIDGWMTTGKPTLVLVPSDLLLQQWKRELATHLAHHDPAVLIVGGSSGRTRWAPLLRSFTSHDGDPRVVVATLQSASQPAFLENIESPESLLVVIDEVHRAGSQHFQKVLSIEAEARLGLSATPTRAGDPDGTARIFEYFERTLQPVFTLKDAIDAKRLTPYTYFVHMVELSKDEQEEWNHLTVKIGREYGKLNSESATAGSRERLKMLQIKRARVVKKAGGKSDIAVDVLTKEFRDGQSWLVYCEDQDQLGGVLARLKAAGLPAFEYHSSMESDRSATMRFYEQNGGIVVAIRCLDEGVDIPRISHALILASSRNPREFVQRRGRVLRKYPHKTIATIHDVLTTPSAEYAGTNAPAGILSPEIARALLFARDAKNKMTELDLLAYARKMGISVESMDEGVEDD